MSEDSEEIENESEAITTIRHIVEKKTDKDENYYKNMLEKLAEKELLEKKEELKALAPEDSEHIDKLQEILDKADLITDESNANKFLKELFGEDTKWLLDVKKEAKELANNIKPFRKPVLGLPRQIYGFSLANLSLYLNFL